MRFLIAGSLVALVVASGAQATARRGTLSGVVMRGPITPVCVAEQPCDEPVPDLTLVFMRDGAVAGRALTNSTGRYRVVLAAGWYSVRRASVRARVDLNLDPNRVRVSAGHITHIGFSIDTGIR